MRQKQIATILLGMILTLLVNHGSIMAQTTGFFSYGESNQVSVELSHEETDGTLYGYGRNYNTVFPDTFWHKRIHTDANGQVLSDSWMPKAMRPEEFVPVAGSGPDMYWSTIHQYVSGGTTYRHIYRTNFAWDTVWLVELPYSSYGRISMQFDHSVLVVTNDSLGRRLTDISGGGVELRTEAGPYFDGILQWYDAPEDGVVGLRTDDGPASNLVFLDSSFSLQNIDTVFNMEMATIKPISSGGYVVAGSYRNADGFRDGFHVVRVDSLGTILWDREYDTPGLPFWVDPFVAVDGAVSISLTYAKIPGLGFNIVGLLELDPSNGDTLWQRLHLPGIETRVGSHLRRLDGSYILQGYEADSCYVDPGFGMSCTGGPNFWFFTDSLGRVDQTMLRGRVFADYDRDSAFSLGDEGLQERIVSWDNGFLQALTDNLGQFQVPIYSADTQSLKAEVPPYFIPFSPSPEAQRTVAVDSLGITMDGLDFAFADTLPLQDLVASLATGILRAGESFNAFISVRNNSTYRMDTVTLVHHFSPDFAYESADTPPDGVIDTTATWTLTDMGIGEHQTIRVRYILTDTTTWAGGSLYRHHVVAEPVGLDYTPEDNVDSLVSLPGWSWDPNDKQVSPAGEGPDHVIAPETDWLDYTIRFQNTGNDTAFAVRLDDLVQANLDLTSFEMLGSTHPYALELVANTRLRWRFPGIVLPDSTSDFAGSQGFVSFRLRPKADLPLGTRINNSASIYFDFNPAVVTNTAFVTLDRPSVVETPASLPDLLLVPNPATDRVQVSWRSEPNVAWASSALRVHVYDLTGRLRRMAEGVLPLQLKVTDLAAGLYLVTVHDQQGALLGRTRLVVR